MKNKINSETAPLYAAISKKDDEQNERIAENEKMILASAIAIIDKRFERGEALINPEQTSNYLKIQIGAETSEVFMMISLDNRNQVIACHRLFFGTIDGASVYPREVVKQALADNAAAVIFAHNHPSGVAEPSQPDIRITGQLKKALALIDIRVLDHFIIGAKVVSFAERGLI